MFYNSLLLENSGSSEITFESFTTVADPSLSNSPYQVRVKYILTTFTFILRTVYLRI